MEKRERAPLSRKTQGNRVPGVEAAPSADRAPTPSGTDAPTTGKSRLHAAVGHKEKLRVGLGGELRWS